MVIAFVLPRIEIQSVASEPVGIAVRGYGVFLLCGVASGVALALYRAKNARVSPDTIFNLAFWLLIGGIVGARTFYVVEYWNDFVSNDVKATLFSLVEEQMKTKMLANVRSEYVFKTIDPPYQPEVKSGPFRSIIVLLTIVVHCFIFLIFIMLYVLLIAHKTPAVKKGTGQ